MPKQTTDPFLLDQVPTLSIKNLRDSRFLETGRGWQTIRWRNQSPRDFGNVEMEIEIIVDTEHSFPSIRFKYTNGKANIDYLIPMVRKRANTGIGKTWYFQPEPGMFCLKLYFHKGRFKGRCQIERAFYRCQVLPLKRLRIDKLNTRLSKIDLILTRHHRKHVKQEYRGVPTKRYLEVEAGLKEMEQLREMNLLN